METSSAPTTLVERDKLDLSSLIPPKGEMESSFSWTCPFKSPTSSTLCFGEPTLGKLNQEPDFYMTTHMPKPSSGANRVSVSHSSLVTKNGEHFYGENFTHDFPKSWKHIKEVDWGDKLKLNYTTYGYMLMEIDWGGKFNYTLCGYPMANWQGHETHPTGHKTSEVDWGGHDPNPNHVNESLLSEVDWGAHNPDADDPEQLTGESNPDGSDKPPPMSIINFDDLLGRTFLLPMDENGERKRATISEHVKDLCQQQVSREDQLRFKLMIDGDQLDDLISYNQLMEYLEDKTDTGPLEDGLYRFKCIKDHKGPYTSSDPEYNGSSYNLLIEWETGEQTWEPLSNTIASDPYSCAVYAKEHNLLNTPRWKLLKNMQKQSEDLLGPSRNQSIDKPGSQENINMDGKSQETMHMHYNLIYTMATTSGRKLLIWKLSKSKNIKYSKILERLFMTRNTSPMHQRDTRRLEYTLYLMSNTVENSRLDL